MVSNSSNENFDPPRIDFYSDTGTRPTDGMRAAMASAEVGNEQAGEDPTVNRLCDMMKELLGMEDAIFLPSGTMCNEIAYRVWCDHGEEIILDKTSHALHFEVGGPAALAGAMVRTVEGTRGIFTGQDVIDAVRPNSRHAQRTALVSVENTANVGGGAVWSVEQMREVSEAAKSQGIPVHLDGARLLNASAAAGVAASEYGALVDSAWIDLSKGLGCPVGAVLAGSADFIDKAWRFKHQFGGAMRQAGIIAAAGVYALEHHVERLKDDHEMAAKLAKGIAGIDGLELIYDQVDTNMVYFDPTGTGLSEREFANRLREHSVRMGPLDKNTVRAVTHLDIEPDMIDEALEALRAVARSG